MCFTLFFCLSTDSNVLARTRSAEIDNLFSFLVPVQALKLGHFLLKSVLALELSASPAQILIDPLVALY